MTNRMTKPFLVAFYIAAMLFTGCIPEDSLQWSNDGSKGIYSKKGALYLVDGATGALAPIAPKETTTLWPAISPDGSQFAYGQIVKVDRIIRPHGCLEFPIQVFGHSIPFHLIGGFELYF